MDSTPNHALEELRSKRETARLGGGLKRQEAIRSSGRGTARDRIGLTLHQALKAEHDGNGGNGGDHHREGDA